MPLTTEHDSSTGVSGSGGRPFTGTPEWLLRIAVESVLIVLSILAALAMDEWREGRHNEQIARQSLQIFETEMRQNMARLDDLLPYHRGIRDVIESMAGDPDRAADLPMMLEGLDAIVPINSAWETALATGALTHIAPATVSALSLTYNLQQRFHEESRTGLQRVRLTVGVTRAQKTTQLQEALVYLRTLVRLEEELKDWYSGALRIVTQSLQSDEPEAAADSVDAA